MRRIAPVTGKAPVDQDRPNLPLEVDLFGAASSPEALPAKARAVQMPTAAIDKRRGKAMRRITRGKGRGGTLEGTMILAADGRRRHAIAFGLARRR